MGVSGRNGLPRRQAEGADLFCLLLIDLRRAGSCDRGDPLAGGKGKRDRVFCCTGE